MNCLARVLGLSLTLLAVYWTASAAPALAASATALRDCGGDSLSLAAATDLIECAIPAADDNDADERVDVALMLPSVAVVATSSRSDRAGKNPPVGGVWVVGEHLCRINC